MKVRGIKKSKKRAIAKFKKAGTAFAGIKPPLQGRWLKPKPPLQGRWLMQYGLGAQGQVNIEQVTESFGMSRGKLAETVGVKPETLQRSSRASAPKTQTRLREMLEIVNRIADWAGGSAQAMAWYRAEPIPAFGGRTAESLVKDGKAAAVRDYLDDVALGGFA
jgi:Antitoxin Xre/MbcA/ParS C-terminal toxin-binding domain